MDKCQFYPYVCVDLSAFIFLQFNFYFLFLGQHSLDFHVTLILSHMVVHLVT